MQAPQALGIERIEARFRGNGFSPHRHDTYALGLTLSGVQTFRYRGVERASLPGQVIVLHPDEVHDGAAGTDDGLTYRMLYMPPERLADFQGHGGMLPFVPDPVVSDEDFRQSLAEALDDLSAQPDALLLDDLIVRLGAGLWRHADDRTGSASSKPARDRLAACRDYLRDNAGRTVGSEELEALCGLDRYQIARQFRVQYGTSPHRYLIMRRLDNAKRLMGRGESLAGAAIEAGFADQAHFTRQFKKAFGMTPGRWTALTRSD
ncbi:MAG: AraC family transcriptional regulator [Neorhizobium sp.]|nr:AraC family transcriptional regulator [Neorhizobium sp.]